MPNQSHKAKERRFYERNKSGKLSSCRLADYDNCYVFMDIYVYQQNSVPKQCKRPCSISIQRVKRIKILKTPVFIDGCFAVKNFVININNYICSNNKIYVRVLYNTQGRNILLKHGRKIK